MTQSSVALSFDNVSWIILNASPDIRIQLAQSEALHPRSLRDSPIAGVMLTNGDVDHVAGLLTLREQTPFELCGTDGMFRTLADNPVFNVLNPALVTPRSMALDEPFNLVGAQITAFAVPGKVALYAEGDVVDTKLLGDQTVGLRIAAGGRCLYYVPGCSELPTWLINRFTDADLLLFDGTVWEDDDMQREGIGSKTGARMGHMPLNGPDGSIAALAGLNCRKMTIHINNTNPVLQPASAARLALLNAGWELAMDGLETEL